MALLGELFQNQQAGLTVYSPDCTQSRLWGNLDQAIYEALGFQIVRRYWINHTINSILNFYRGPDDEPIAEQDTAEAIRKYDLIPPEKLQPGHMVVKLLLMGPVLVTIWRGDNAVPRLLELKGKTLPSEAVAGSIRGGFWCDNGVCNLMHTSDDSDEAKRELAALNLDHWLDEEEGQISLMEPIPAPQAYVAHSGISIVCDVVKRVLNASNESFMAPYLPPSGDAKETNQRLNIHLREIAARHADVAPFIEAFLTGDLVAVTKMLQALPVTRWEHFVIQCGVLNRAQWNAAI